MMVLLMITSLAKAQEIGNPAPDFTLEDLDGQSFTLSDQVGKVVVIFVFGYSCPYCVSSGPVIEEKLVKPYLENEDYVIVGVDIWNGNAGSVTTFKNNTGLTIPLLLNAGGLASDYNTVQDRLFVIDQEGFLVYRSNTAAINDYANVVSIVNEKLDVISSIQLSGSDDFSFLVFPNPVISDELNLSFILPETGLASINVVNSDGRTLFLPVREKFLQGKNFLTLSIGNIPAGLYYAVLTFNGRHIHRKIRIL
jgi:peroxiredoxin